MTPTPAGDQPPNTRPGDRQPDPAVDPRVMKALAGTAGVGAAVLAVIGFTGSYHAVRELAVRKGFGWFADVFPVGVDAGILALIALDLYLTHRRMAFPPLRWLAWLLTAATVAFNAAAAKGPITADPLAASMHAVIPVLFIAATEASRHYIGRLADITAERHIESPPLIRWFLAPLSTYRIWRRMRLYNLRSYSMVIDRQREALVYQAKLRGRYGWMWRRRAEADELLALRLASRYGTPIAETLDQSASVTAPGPTDVERVAATAPPSATERVPLSATERPALTAAAATSSATVAPATNGTRHDAPQARERGATTPATPLDKERPQDATAPATTDATITPAASAPAAATDTTAATAAPRHSVSAPVASAPKRTTATAASGRSAAKDAIFALYERNGRRPIESEMVAELKRIRCKHTSRQFAGKVRREIERDNPALAALGADNVRLLTGTDG